MSLVIDISQHQQSQSPIKKTQNNRTHIKTGPKKHTLTSRVNISLGQRVGKDIQCKLSNQLNINYKSLENSLRLLLTFITN